MKIDPTLKTLPTAPVVEERARTQKQQSEKAAESRGEVQLSALSSRMRDIEAKLESEKSVDSKRVSEIKQAIAEKRFEVNSSIVADKLLEGTREFLRSQKQ